jgi:6,7-dimethyl-8-ribityllumazine synthase
MASSLRNLSSYDPAQVPDGKSMTIALVVSDWNREITGALEQGAIDTLLEHGVLNENIHVRHVPGSFELPLGGQIVIESLHPDAVILLGCVIQGETRHFDFICDAVSRGCMDLGLKTGIPVIFGVLTTQDLQQAIDRAGGKHGNKGTEAAITALKMIQLKKG